MKTYVLIGGIASVSLLTLLSGCSTKRQPQATIPVPISAGVQSLPGSPAELGDTQNSVAPVPAEERLDYERVTVPPLRPATEIAVETEVKGTESESPVRNPPVRNSRPSPTGASRPVESGTVTEPEAPKPADVRMPALRPMISDAERRQLESQILANLERVKRNIASIRTSRLGLNERNALEEARNFALRADQLKVSDPVLANSLAERAAILTQEILRKQ